MARAQGPRSAVEDEAQSRLSMRRELNLVRCENKELRETVEALAARQAREEEAARHRIEVEGLTLLTAADRGDDVACCIILDNAASFEERARILLQTDDEGWTALHRAAHKGHRSCMEVLLGEFSYGDLDGHPCCSSRGGNDLQGCCAATAAALFATPRQQLQEDRTMLLVARSPTGDTPLHCAAAQGHVDCARLMLTCADSAEGRTNLLVAENSSGCTCLHSAATMGHEEFVDFLLNISRTNRSEHHRFLMAQGDDGWTALQKAAWQGHEACVRALLHGEGAVTRKWLLGLPMYDGHQGSGGSSSTGHSTVLHQAASEGHKGCVEALLSYASSPEDRSAMLAAEDNYGSTPLHAAASAGSEECLRALLASVDSTERSKLRAAVNAHGWTPLHNMVFAGHGTCVASLLLDVKSREERWDIMTAKLVPKDDEDDEEAGWRWCRGWTPLHFAARYGRAACVRALLDLACPEECSVMLNARDDKGQTPGDVAQDRTMWNLLRKVEQEADATAAMRASFASCIRRLITCASSQHALPAA